MKKCIFSLILVVSLFCNAASNNWFSGTNTIDVWEKGTLTSTGYVSTCTWTSCWNGVHGPDLSGTNNPKFYPQYQMVNNFYTNNTIPISKTSIVKTNIPVAEEGIR